MKLTNFSQTAKKNRDKDQIIKIIINFREIKRIIKEYFEQYANKLCNLKEMDKLQERHKISELHQKERISEQT